MVDINWHKAALGRRIGRNGAQNKYARPPSVYRLTGARHRVHLPEFRIVHRDTKGNPISLPRVSILERYDEKGNPT